MTGDHAADHHAADQAADRGLVHDEALRARLRANLSEVDDRPPPAGDGADRGHAAVAIVVHPDALGCSQLYVIMRAAHLGTHAGQYGLPGGSLEPGEGPATAARRELAEELGISLPAEAVVGRLVAYVTRSGFRIHPVVLWSDRGHEVVPDPGEVAAVHRAPLGALDRAVVSGRARNGVPMLGTSVFAPTGEILRRFVVVGLHGRDPGPGFREPRFAWR